MRPNASRLPDAQQHRFVVGKPGSPLDTHRVHQKKNLEFSMAYLVRIGTIPTNKGGVGARGYHLFRRGTWVSVEWGGVLVKKGRVFVWGTPPQSRTYRCGTSARAISRYLEILARRIRHGYHELPPGRRIGRARTEK